MKADPWLWWALLSALFAGTTAVLAKAGIEGLNSHLVTAIRTTVVLVFSWSIALSLVPLRTLGEISSRAWFFLVASGLATGLSWLCYYRALQLGRASSVAPVDKLSVIVAIALAAIFLKEKLGWQHWVGGILIVLGSLIIAWPAAGR